MKPIKSLHNFFDSATLLLVLTTLFWGGNVVAGQMAVGEIGPMQLVLFRWIGVSVALGLIYRRQITEHWPSISAQLPKVILMAVLGFTIFNGLFYIASHRTSGLNIGILQGALPAWVLLGALWAYGTKIRGLQIIGVILTMIGVIIVATKGVFSPQALTINFGDLLMLIATVCYAAYTVMLQKRPEVPGVVLFAVFAIISALTAMPLAAGEALLQGWQWPSLQGWLVTAYVTIFPSCLSQIFFLRAVDLIGPGRAGVYINLVPIFGAFLAVMMLGEVFGWHHALALGLVIGGIWLSQRGARKTA